MSRVIATFHRATRPMVGASWKTMDYRGRTRTTKSLVDVTSSVQRLHCNTYYETQFSIPLSTLSTSGQSYRGRIKQESFSKIKSACLKFIVTVSPNTAQLVGTPSWFDRIEWWWSNGSKHLSTMYSQNMMFNLQLLGRDAIWSANIDPENYCPLYETLAASTTRTYFLPLLAIVF